jgi:AbrB family looped-hinge helix DNA binding protein
MTSRVGAKGQVVIPKQMRDQTGLHPGSTVEFELADEGVKVAAAGSAATLGGRFAGSGMAGRLLADRALEPR